MAACVGCAASGKSVVVPRDNVTEAQFRDEIRKSDVPVLVVTGASWCGPCVALNGRIDGIAADYDGWVRFMYVNADTSIQVANALRINAIPTTVLFDGGKEVDRNVGAFSRDQLRTMLNRVLDVEEN